MKCCAFLLFLFRRKKAPNISPSVEIIIEDRKADQSQGKTPLKDDMSLSVTGISGNLIEKIPLPQAKVRPKVYGMMRGTASICHTPSLDKSPIAKARKVSIKKGEVRSPRSALLASDVEAKKALLLLRAERSRTQDCSNEDGIDTATNRLKPPL